MPASPSFDLPAERARRLKARREPLGARDLSDGATLSPNSLPYRPSVLPGSTSCRRRARPRQPVKRCKPCRSRSQRTERCRAAARVWPRLSRPLTATRQSLHPTPSGLTRNPTRDITPTTRWVTPPRPPSDRNGGRFQIGMGGRFQIGIPGRLRRNPQTDWIERSLRPEPILALLVALVFAESDRLTVLHLPYVYFRK